ncbi:MAG: glycoside hydrolase family 44 protein [Anaerolineales bacterium]
MKSTFLLVAILLVVCAGCEPATPEVPTPAVPTTLPNALVVEPDKDLGPISSYVYGSNYGPWTAVPVDMIPVALNAHITVLRWPGGAWGDENDIQTYQLDTFMAFCKQMGAIPTISVRLLGGTPEAAAALVHYANIEKGYGIQYWSIGNEPTLYAEQTQQPYDTVRFNQDWRAIAKAMKAVDPKIKLMGPELHQWGTSLATTPKDAAGWDWMTEFLKANGDLVDIVTIHRYPLYSETGHAFTVADLRNDTLEWTGMVTYLRGLIKTTTRRDIPIAFTEVNSNPSNVIEGVATPDSFYNAIWYADVLGRLIQQNVFMVNQFVLADRSGGLGLIYNSTVRPMYYVFQMYSHFGNEQVYAVSGTPDVSVYAAKRADGTLTVMVINLADSAQKVPLSIQGNMPTSADVWSFDATHNAVDLGQQPFANGGEVVLPAQSITLYAISK